MKTLNYEKQAQRSSIRGTKNLQNFDLQKKRDPVSSYDIEWEKGVKTLKQCSEQLDQLGRFFKIMIF